MREWQFGLRITPPRAATGVACENNGQHCRRKHDHSNEHHRHHLHYVRGVTKGANKLPSRRPGKDSREEAEVASTTRNTLIDTAHTCWVDEGGGERRGGEPDTFLGITSSSTGFFENGDATEGMFPPSRLSFRRRSSFDGTGIV